MKSRQLCEAFGRCWHYTIMSEHGNHECSCGLKFDVGIDFINHKNRNNPDYAAHPWLVIEHMEEAGSLEKFLLYVWDRDIPSEMIVSDPLLSFSAFITITRSITTDKTGKLLDLALEFMEERK